MKIGAKNLRYFFHTIRQIDKWFIITFAIAVLCLLNYETYFIKRFWETNFTKGLNLVLVQILYAYVAGFIFYVFVELVPNHKKVIGLFRLINSNIYWINRWTDSLINAICLTNPPFKEGHKVSVGEFSQRCARINIYQTHVETWYYPNNTFRNYVLWTCDKIRQNVDQLVSYSNLLNDEWINRLSHIQDAIRNIELFLELNKERSTLSLSAAHVWVLYNDAQELKVISDEFFKKYYRIHQIKNPPGEWIRQDISFEVKKNV